MTRPLVFKRGQPPSRSLLHFDPKLEFDTISDGLVLLADAAILETSAPHHAMIRKAMEKALVVLRSRPLNHEKALAHDIGLAMRLGAAAILLPQVRCGADIQQLHAYLDVEEIQAGITPGSTAIIAICGDNSAGILNAATFAGKSERLRGLAFDPSAFRADTDLPAAESATEQTARAMTIMAASAAGVSSVLITDPVTDFAESARKAARDGFDAMTATTIGQAQQAIDQLTPNR